MLSGMGRPFQNDKRENSSIGHNKGKKNVHPISELQNAESKTW
jgi:hypothetical protein